MSPCLSRVDPGAWHRSLHTVVVCAATFLGTAASAVNPGPTGGVDGGSPPAYADDGDNPLPRGCFVSAAVYLARFRREFPGVPARFLALPLKGEGGPHTVALVSWRGEWWIRDGRYGAGRLRVSAAAVADAGNDVVRRAEGELRRLAKSRLAAGRGRREWSEPGCRGRDDRRRAVTRAARLLPCASRVFWLSGPDGEVPVLFFRPEVGIVAIYDPARGTVSARCGSENVEAVVAIAGEALGYSPGTVRADATASAGPARPAPATGADS